MLEQYSRAALLYGEEGLSRLRRAHVAVFGLGGVGSYAVEALARSGVGRLTLVDNDRVSLSNLNRQLFALHSTLGMRKTDAARERVGDIDPEIRVETSDVFFLPETAENFDFSQYDFVVDAIDTVTGKLCLVLSAQAAGTEIVSAMGAGNRRDPSCLRIADIYATSGCPLARIMRKELRKRGVKALPAVYSQEEPARGMAPPDPESSRREIPGSSAFVPAAAGLLLASYVVNRLVGLDK